MARQINRLTARSVTSLKEPGLHADGHGLYLSIKSSGAKSWTFIYRFNGKRREMGLGSASAVSLAKARERRDEARAKVADGVDPLAPQSSDLFSDVAKRLIASLSQGWKNAKHKEQWGRTLELHAANLWSKPVAQITTNDVIAALSPIWLEHPQTATRLRGRIERVLAAAKVEGHRSGDNPARWREHLELMLPRRPMITKRHYPSMPYEDVPGFMNQLRVKTGVSARALEFTVLAAARTGEVLRMRWSEIDFDNALWTVPAERMKTSKLHRVPLTARMIAILQHQIFLRNGADGFVFRGTKKDSSLSNMAMEMLLRRMGVEEYTVHGFRSSFRDWAGDCTDSPREVAEAALSHAVGDAVERAYRRGDALGSKPNQSLEKWLVR